MEIYRGYEIHADLTGYGYLAHLPNYDGEPCLHHPTLDGIKGEIDMLIEGDDLTAQEIAQTELDVSMTDQRGRSLLRQPLSELKRRRAGAP